MRSTADRARLVAVAQGTAEADLVLEGGRVLNVFSRSWVEAPVAIAAGRIAGVGGAYEGPRTDLEGRYLVPGLVDAHVHVESSKVAPHEFGRLISARGTTTAVTDPHEIANVCGLPGVRWLLDAADGAPADLLAMAPCCVPASALEGPGATFGIAQMRELLDDPRVLGVAEAMNFPAVIGGDPAELDKLGLAPRVDGHAPGLLGAALDAYLAAGIRTDHECSTAEEARQRVLRGAWVLLREGSAARNLRDLLPAVRELGIARFAFCTDDRTPDTLLEAGSIADLCRIAVEEGVPAEDALVMASLNGARCHGLEDRGAIAPGQLADLVVLEELERFRAVTVLKAGEVVGRDGASTVPRQPVALGAPVVDTVRLAPVDRSALALPAGRRRLRTVRPVAGQILTRAGDVELDVADGAVPPADRSRVARMAVLDRHHASGRTGLGLVEGFGLARGAIASTVAHDAHQLVVVFQEDRDLEVAAQRVAELGGGLVAVEDGEVVAELALPIAGLMSDQDGPTAADGLRAVRAAATRMGVTEPDCTMTLSFLALSVIPELRITDHGVVDVLAARVVGLEA